MDRRKNRKRKRQEYTGKLNGRLLYTMKTLMYLFLACTSCTLFDCASFLNFLSLFWICCVSLSTYYVYDIVYLFLFCPVLWLSII